MLHCLLAVVFSSGRNYWFVVLNYVDMSDCSLNGFVVDFDEVIYKRFLF